MRWPYRACVLEQRHIARNGPAHEIAQDPAARAACLGTKSTVGVSATDPEPGGYIGIPCV